MACGKKLRGRGIRRCGARLWSEELERRTLLAVTAAEYDSIRGMYPEFDLPADMADINIIEIASSDLSMGNLQSAIWSVEETIRPDLIVARTTDTQNRIGYAAEPEWTGISISTMLSEPSALSIVGFGTQPLTLDAEGTSSVMVIGGVEDLHSVVNLGGMTLTGGDAMEGGGIAVSGVDLTLRNVTITGNTAFNGGGGIAQDGGNLVLTNVTISGNSVEWYDGGGGFLQNSGTSTLTNVTIRNNASVNGNGGGMNVVRGIASLTNVTMSGNSGLNGGGFSQYFDRSTLTDVTISDNTIPSSGRGGGVYNYSGGVMLTNVTISRNGGGVYGGGLYGAGGGFGLVNSTISSNQSRGGGGIYQSGGSLSVFGGIIAGNSAATSGGGVVSNASTTIRNVTISGNEASQYGGGIYGLTGTLTLDNSIIAKNLATSGPDWYQFGSIYQAKYNLIGDGTGQPYSNGVSGNLVGSVANPIDPQFVDMSSPDKGQWNLRLQATSPAVNAGNNTLAPWDIPDLDGRPRIIGGTVDMGAYELDQAPTDIALSATGVAENRSTGTTVGSLSTTDPDASDTFSYTLVAGAGDGDNASFAINGAMLTTGVTFDYETRSSYSIRVRSTDASGLWVEKSFTVSVTDVDEIAPTISSVSINSGAIQRSMVRRLEVLFSEPVRLLEEAITVRLADGSAVPNTTISVSSTDQQAWVVLFSGTAAPSGSLADGIYELIVAAAGVEDLAGNALGGDYRQKFHRLFGDVDGNKVVNASDYTALRNTFDKHSTDAGFNEALDYENNLVINASDLTQFRKRFGVRYVY